MRRVIEDVLTYLFERDNRSKSVKFFIFMRTCDCGSRLPVSENRRDIPDYDLELSKKQ